MNTKSLLTGAGLVIIGIILGVLVSRHCPAKCGKDKKHCPTEQVGNDSTKCHKRNFDNGDFRKSHCMMNPCMLQSKMAEELSLTPEQKSKIDAIFEAKRTEAEAHRKEMMTKMTKVHEEIKSILTEEQKTKFDAIVTDVCPIQKGDMKDGKPCCNKQKVDCPKK